MPAPRSFRLVAAVALAQLFTQASWSSLPCGMAFPLKFENGRTKIVCGAEYANQSMFIILSTRPGERVMRPEFGFDWSKYWGPVNESQKKEMLDKVRLVLSTYIKKM